MKYKNLTVTMSKRLTKLKLIDDYNKWGYSKNTPVFIELINKETKEKMIINKEDYNIKDF